jgi:hypothetical protein
MRHVRLCGRACNPCIFRPLAITDEATWRGLSARCPALGRAPRCWAFDRDEPWVRISTDALKVAARSLKRSAALYTQPHHLRVVAIVEGGVDALLPVCARVLNGGELPEAHSRLNPGTVLVVRVDLFWIWVLCEETGARIQNNPYPRPGHRARKNGPSY